MSKKQIRRDYENIDYLDEKGKVKTKVVYKGAYYKPKDAKTFKRNGIWLFLITVLCLAGLLIPLIVINSVVKALYFSLPFILQGVSEVFYLIAVLNFFMERPPFNEKTKKSFSGNVKGASAFGIICSAIYLVGYIVLLIKGDITGLLDIITGVFALICTFCHIIALLLGRKAEFIKTSAIGEGYLGNNDK